MGTRNPALKHPARQAARLILPQPKRLAWRAGEFRLRAGLSLKLPATLGTTDRRIELAALQTKQEILDRTGLELNIECSASQESDSASITCQLDRSAALSPRATTARDAY
ncbi:MAG: hypothetical protein VCB25_10850, partial [Myxococcota bacterium]